MQACTGHRTVATARLVVRRGQGVAGKVYERGRPVCVDDYDADPRISRDFIDIAHADGTRAALGAPMAVRGRTIGVAMSWRRRPAVYTTADVQAMTTLANLAAIAVENARLYEAQRRTVDGLQQANRRLESQNERPAPRDRGARRAHARSCSRASPLGDARRGRRAAARRRRRDARRRRSRDGRQRRRGRGAAGRGWRPASPRAARARRPTSGCSCATSRPAASGSATSASRCATRPRRWTSCSSSRRRSCARSS